MTKDDCLITERHYKTVKRRDSKHEIIEGKEGQSVF